MVSDKIKATGTALAILVMAIVPSSGYDALPSFGVIDPSYRSAHPDTAWFLRQPGDEAPPVDDADLADGAGASLLADRDSGDAVALVALVQHINP